MIIKIKFLDLEKTAAKVINALNGTEKEIWIMYEENQDIDSLEREILGEIASFYFESGRIKFVRKRILT